MKRTTNVLKRRGVTSTEVLVSAGLLVSVIGLVSTLTHRTRRLLHSSRQYQVALQELANQIELVSLLNPSQIDDALQRLQVSSTAADALQDCLLQGKNIDDQDGQRIVLSMTWNGVPKGAPIELVRWVDPETSAGVLESSEVER